MVRYNFSKHGGIFGVEALVQKVDDVELLIVKVNGKGFYSGIVVFYGDGIITPRDFGFGLIGYNLFILAYILLYFIFRLFSS
jgi:hypothetical protein